MLRRAHAGIEYGNLRLEGFVERYRERILDRIDRAQPSVETAEPPPHRRAGPAENLRVCPRRLDRFVPIAGAGQLGGLRLLGYDLAGK